MPLIPYNHFEGLDKWFDDEWPGLWGRAGRILPRISRGIFMATPKVNIYEDGDNLVAEVGLPGINAEDIDVEVEDNLLKVEAKKEQKEEEKKKDYFRQEMSRGYFKRIIPLPVEVREDKIDAVYQKGVLKVIMPKVKKEKKEEKKVKVKVKSA